jgi:hypothetical protein
MLEGEQDGPILEVEVVELVDQARAANRSRRSGGGSRIRRFQCPRRSGRTFAVCRGATLGEAEVLLNLVHNLDPNLTDPFVRLVRKELTVSSWASLRVGGRSDALVSSGRERTREGRVIVVEDRQAILDRKNNNRVTRKTIARP